MDIELFYIDHGFASEKYHCDPPPPARDGATGEEGGARTRLIPVTGYRHGKTSGGRSRSSATSAATPSEVFVGKSSWGRSEDAKCPGRAMFLKIVNSPAPPAPMTVVYLDADEGNVYGRRALPQKMKLQHYGDLVQYAKNNGMIEGSLTDEVPGVQTICTVNTVEYVTAVCEGLQQRLGTRCTSGSGDGARKWGVIVLALDCGDPDTLPRLRRNDKAGGTACGAIKCAFRTFPAPIICDIAVLLATTDARSVFPGCMFVD